MYTKYLASNVTKHTLDNPKTQSTREIANMAIFRRKIKLKALKNAKKDNGLAFHHQKMGHDFVFDNTKILQQDKNYWRRLILEGIEIKYNENLVNLQSGYMIDKCWIPSLDKTEKVQT